MKLLRRLLLRKTIKGFEYRLKNLEDMLEKAQDKMSKLNEQIEQLELEKPYPKAAINKLKEERRTWTRLYWDSYNRHDEVESGLTYLTRDFDGKKTS